MPRRVARGGASRESVGPTPTWADAPHPVRTPVRSESCYGHAALLRARVLLAIVLLFGTQNYAGAVIERSVQRSSQGREYLPVARSQLSYVDAATFTASRSLASRQRCKAFDGDAHIIARVLRPPGIEFGGPNLHAYVRELERRDGSEGLTAGVTDASSNMQHLPREDRLRGVECVARLSEHALSVSAGPLGVTFVQSGSKTES